MLENRVTLTDIVSKKSIQVDLFLMITRHKYSAWKNGRHGDVQGHKVGHKERLGSGDEGGDSRDRRIVGNSLLR